jgi:hypothetical protein
MAAKKIEQKRQTVERYFTELTTLAISTPQDDPADPKCRWGMPAAFWGGSGIGKSDQVKQAGARANLGVEVLFPGQQQPENFSGVLVPNPNSPEGVSIQCLLPAVRRLNRIGKGILFVDEAANAPPAVQGAMLGMLLDRVVGDTPMSPYIRILLASNPPEIAAGGYGFEPPTANRMAHFFLGPPSWEMWNRWFMSKSQPIKPTGDDLEGKVRNEWPNIYPMAQGLVSGFLQGHSSMLYNQPAAGDPNGGFAWPSPRTWDNVSKIMAARMILKLPEELDDIAITSLVGEGPTQEFAEWRHHADLPTPDDVLAGNWKIDKKRLDKVHAVLGTLVPYVGMKPEGAVRFDTAVKVWNVLDQVCDAGMADMIVDHMTVMINQYQLGMLNKTPQNVKVAAEKVIKRMGRSTMAQFVGTPSP